MKLPIKTCSIRGKCVNSGVCVCVCVITGNKDIYLMCLRHVFKKKGKLEHERSLSFRTQISL